MPEAVNTSKKHRNKSVWFWLVLHWKWILSRRVVACSLRFKKKELVLPLWNSCTEGQLQVTLITITEIIFNKPPKREYSMRFLYQTWGDTSVPSRNYLCFQAYYTPTKIFLKQFFNWFTGYITSEQRVWGTFYPILTRDLRILGSFSFN